MTGRPAPRVAPLPESQWDPEIRAVFGRENDGGLPTSGRVLNIFRTLAHHPKLLRRWTVFGNHVLFKSTLPPRERELIILRIGWLCRSEYEFGQHTRIGRQAGLTDDEILRITVGPDALHTARHDRARQGNTGHELHVHLPVAIPPHRRARRGSTRPRECHAIVGCHVNEGDRRHPRRIAGKHHRSPSAEPRWARS